MQHFFLHNETSYFHLFKDIDLLDVCRELKKIIVLYINSEISDEDYNNKCSIVIPKFEKEFDLYLKIDWNRIKVETAGKRKKVEEVGK